MIGLAVNSNSNTITVLSDFFPPYNNGGAETVAYNLSSQYAQMGYRVHVITTVNEQDQAGRQDETGITIHRLYAKCDERFRAYWGLYNPSVVRQTAKLFQVIRPAIVHAHNVHGRLSYHILTQASLSNAFLITTLHDAMSFDYGKCKQCVDYTDVSANPRLRYRISAWKTLREYRFHYFPLRNRVIRSYFKKWPQQIVAVSYELKKLITANGVRCDTVIHNGVDLTHFSISGGQRQLLIEEFKKKYNLLGRKPILFVGRISTLKGFQQLNAAFEIIRREIPSACLLVAGVAPWKEALAPRMDGVVFTGWLSGADLLAAYLVSSLVVTPSIYPDPFPTVNLEAMACGKPVVATVFGGTKEIVQDGVTGYIVNPLNIDQLSNKILEILKSPGKAESMGRRGRQRALTEFSLEKQAEAYLHLITKDGPALKS